VSLGIPASAFDFDMALVVGLKLGAVSLIYLQTHAYQHHLPTFFRPLRKINVGDEIRFFTNAGTFKYRVVSLRIVLPDAIEVLNDTQRPTLTLVTSYPFYYIGSAPKRFIVHAEMATASPN
jgi:sortase A